MLSDELESIHINLGELLNKVDPNTAQILRICRRNLEAAADDARNMENNLYLKEMA